MIQTLVVHRPLPVHASVFHLPFQLECFVIQLSRIWLTYQLREDLVL